MASPQIHSGPIRFGPFALDPSSRELRRRGYLVRLRPQQIALLLLLTERAGQIVSREEIHQHIWGNDTFVDFERGINFSINQIRVALGDDADKPRYIETIPRRGYRFIASTEWDPLDSPVLADGQPLASTQRQQSTSPTITIAQPETECAPALPAPRLKMTPRFVIAGAVFVIAIFAAAWWLRLRTAGPVETKLQQLTHNSSDNPITGVTVSPDGKYFVYSDLRGLHVKLLRTGEVHDYPQPSELGKSPAHWLVVWLPDSARFLAVAWGNGITPSTWQASVVSGGLQLLRKDAVTWSVSPDGSQFVFTDRNERVMWTVGMQGDHLRKIADAGEKNWFSYIAWSPDGSRLLDIKRQPSATGFQNFMELRDLRSGNTTTLLSSAALRSLYWLHNGRVLYVESNLNTNGDSCHNWIADLGSGSAQISAKPLQQPLLNGLCISSASDTADGSQLYFLKESLEFSVYVSDLSSDATRISPPRHLTLTDNREFPAAWTADSREVVLVSNREGKWGFYRQAIDSDVATPVLIQSHTHGLGSVFPRLAPDGAWLVYAPYPADHVPGAPMDIWKVPISGGSPQWVMKSAVYDTPRCARAPSLLCAVARKEKDELIFRGFDPERGAGPELARLRIGDPEKTYTWDLSPDATRIAILERGTAEIHIFSLRTHVDQKVIVKGWGGLDALDWTADGKGLFTSSQARGSVLLHSDLHGNANILWEPKGPGLTWAIPSPDGRHVAMPGYVSSGNVWSMNISGL